MLLIRTWHTYLGILIAPSVIFFALTGAIQLFSLHEAHGTYEPPPLLEKLSSLHKDQIFGEKEQHEDEQQPKAGAAPGDHEATPARQDHETKSTGTVLLKWYFLMVAIALTTSTLFGLWMGLTHIKHKRTCRWLLGVGLVIPVAVTLLI
jgi:hypothetical protein